MKLSKTSLLGILFKAPKIEIHKKADALANINDFL